MDASPQEMPAIWAPRDSTCSNPYCETLLTNRRGIGGCVRHLAFPSILVWCYIHLVHWPQSSRSNFLQPSFKPPARMERWFFANWSNTSSGSSIRPAVHTLQITFIFIKNRNPQEKESKLLIWVFSTMTIVKLLKYRKLVLVAQCFSTYWRMQP